MNRLRLTGNCREMKRIASILLMASAAASMLLSSVLMLQKREPFYTWYYCFAWWSFILLGQAFLQYRLEKSTLFSRPFRFLLWLPMSLTIWLIFEIFNFRLDNWHYINLPASRSARWAGYTAGFSTVLPGLFTTKALLEQSSLFRTVCSPCSASAQPTGGALIPLGAAFLTLPLLWPSYFFPLVWLGFIFLLDPLNSRLGAESLLLEARQGSRRDLLLIPAAGMICGFLWEFWNFWAGSKWIYTIPHVGGLKVFEMPILGFFGFAPFAAECFVMSGLLTALLDRVRQIRSSTVKAAVALCISLFVVLFTSLVFSGIDRFTVISFKD